MTSSIQSGWFISELRSNAWLNCLYNTIGSRKQFVKTFLLDNSINSIDIKPNLNLSSNESFGIHENWIGLFQKDMIFFLKLKGFNNIKVNEILISSFSGEIGYAFFESCGI